MKKLLVILLGFCIAVPAFAAGVRAVDNDAWLDHLGQMQIIRQQILSLITKPNPTANDKAVLETLKTDFAAKKMQWDNYLVKVSQTPEKPKAKYESKLATKGCGTHKNWKHQKRTHKRAWKKSCKGNKKGCGEHRCRKGADKDCQGNDCNKKGCGEHRCRKGADKDCQGNDCNQKRNCSQTRYREMKKGCCD